MRTVRILLLTGLLPALTLARHPERLTVYWGVVANQDNGRARWELTLVNQDTVALPASGWTLYFNFMRPILPESAPPSVRLTHVNGDFYRLDPTDTFAPLPPGARRTLSFESMGPLIKAIDAPSGLYLVFQEAPNRPVPIQDVRVLPFASEFQTRRHLADRLPVPTPALRYYRNAPLRLLPADSLTPVIPTPRHLTRREGHWTLDRTAAIAYDPALAREAAFLADVLASLLDARPLLLEGADQPATIRLRLGAVRLPDGPAGPEAYHLIVDPEAGITLTGTDAAGVFYGIQTLQQLIDPSFYRQTSEAIPIPALEVRDAPRFGYRGLHLDVARNFHPKEVVLRLLDLMARYKLNRFHFHLTDDEGWRLEIEGLPELTEVGGCRGHTETEATCLVPSHGSGPIPGRLEAATTRAKTLSKSCATPRPGTSR